MGIPGFFGRFLSRKVVKAIFQGLPTFVSSLSFDANGVYHDARKTVVGEGVTDPRILQAIANTSPSDLEREIENEVEKIILKMVLSTNPQDCLIIAVDGVAPGAKLQQQKGRRERAARDRSPNESFDKNAITPGTEFMIRLDSFMIRFIGKHRAKLPPKVIYSSHLVPGEGEHKIMDYYRSGQASDGPIAKQGGAHVLYGLDADLIMLSLLAPISNIYLSRESVKETLNIDYVKDYLMDIGKRPSSVDDFIIMLYLLGNDFLPHMPAFEDMAESISILLDIYASGDYVLTYTDPSGRHHINWESMKPFLTAVSANENMLLATLSAKEVTYPSRFLQAAVRQGQFYPDAFRSSWYKNALGPKGTPEFTHNLEQIISRNLPLDQDIRISSVTPLRIVNMSIDYMRTMSWIYLYYREGTSSINHDWCYPHYHSPMLVDLAAVMQRVNSEISIDGYKSYDGMVTFTALHQLVAVMPLKSKNLIPKELQPLFTDNSIIRDLFPDNFIVEMDGKNKIGPGQVPGVPIVPMVDRQRIMDAVSQIVFSPSRAKLWMPTSDEIFVLTDAETQMIAHSQFDKQRQANFVSRQRAREKGRKQREEGSTEIISRDNRGEFRANRRSNTQVTRSPAIIPIQQGQRIQMPIMRGRGPTLLPIETKNTVEGQRIQMPIMRGRGPTLLPIETTNNVDRIPVSTLNLGAAPFVPGKLMGEQRGGKRYEVKGEKVEGIEVAKVGRGKEQGAKSPGQWKELPTLM